tara:strand:+ start:317 stop:493 length:177 start_codon:yes stop_codon:yes gene_type:complete
MVRKGFICNVKVFYYGLFKMEMNETRNKINEIRKKINARLGVVTPEIEQQYLAHTGAY